MEENNFQVKGIGFEDHYASSKNRTYYSFQVKYRGMSWEICNRFSDFMDLHAILSSFYSNLPFPPKKTLLPVKKLEKKQERLDQLAEYLLKLSNIPETMGDSYFQEFTEVRPA